MKHHFGNEIAQPHASPHLETNMGSSGMNRRKSGFIGRLRKAGNRAWSKTEGFILRNKKTTAIAGTTFLVTGAVGLHALNSRLSAEHMNRLKFRKAEFKKIGIADAEQFALFSTTKFGKKHAEAFDRLPSGVKVEIINITRKVFAQHPESGAKPEEMLGRVLETLSGSKGDFEARAQEFKNRAESLKNDKSPEGKKERARLLRAEQAHRLFAMYAEPLKNLRPDAFEKIRAAFE